MTNPRKHKRYRPALNNESVYRRDRAWIWCGAVVVALVIVGLCALLSAEHFSVDSCVKLGNS